MSDPALTWHRRAERWCGWADLFAWRGRPEVAGWCLRRALRAERAALAGLVALAPERRRTRQVLERSVEALEAAVREAP